MLCWSSQASLSSSQARLICSGLFFSWKSLLGSLSVGALMFQSWKIAMRVSLALKNSDINQNFVQKQQQTEALLKYRLLGNYKQPPQPGRYCGSPALPLKQYELWTLKGIQQRGMSSQRHQQQLYEEILVKFIINLPPQQIENPNRLSYQTEKALYYYLDNILCISNPQNWEKLRSQFLARLTQFAPAPLRFDPRKIAIKIQENKPVCGAIVFNKDESKVLLIRVRNKLGFPKGKWNQHESARECAAREVQEETGVYIHNRMDPDIEISFESHGSSTCFFVARGISEEDRLKIDSRQIDDIFWMRVTDIEPNKWKLAEKSRTAWEHFQRITKKRQTDFSQFEQFMEKYQLPWAQQKPADSNPFENFKLDRQALKRALFAGLD